MTGPLQGMTGPLHERGEAHALLAAEAERARAGSGRRPAARRHGYRPYDRPWRLPVAAASRGMRVLRARCSPEDSAVPLSTVLQLLCSVPEFADLTAGDDERGSAARLWRLLRSYADEAPLLLAVDDVHLADGASRRWLVDVARRIDRLPAPLVATERSQYDIDPPAAGLAHALSPSLVRSHTLAPLTDTAAVELVRAAFPSASPRWTADCLSAGAGSPLLLRLLDDLGAMAPEAPATGAEHPRRPVSGRAPGRRPVVAGQRRPGDGAEVARALAALELTGPSTAGEEATVSWRAARQVVRLDRDHVTDVTDSIDVTDVADSIDGVGEETPGAAGFPAPDSVDLLAETVAYSLGRRVAHRDGVAGGAARRWSAGARGTRIRCCGTRCWPGGRVGRRQQVYLAAAEAMVRRGDRARAVARPLLRTRAVGLPWASRVLR
ncbi:hypothetical protein SALBM311S_04106 [Streptomyces alboniger]